MPASTIAILYAGRISLIASTKVSASMVTNVSILMPIHDQLMDHSGRGSAYLQNICKYLENL